MWQFIPLSEYVQNETAVVEPEKGVGQHIWDRYFSRKKIVENTEVEFVSPELQSVPTRILDWIAPPPNWQEACGPQPELTQLPPPQPDLLQPKLPQAGKVQIQEALDPELERIDFGDPEFETADLNAGQRVSQQLSMAFEEWQSSRAKGPGIRMVLTSPHSEIEDMVQGWAQRHGYLLTSTPTTEQVLDLANPWLDELKQRVAEFPEHERRKVRVVIVGLEDYYIRHHSGLHFLRNLVDYLVTDAPPSLVVCNSWAWAYLRDAIHIDAMVQPPLTLERCSGETLGTWLRELSSGSHYRAFIFRQGGEILFRVGGDSAGVVNEYAYRAFCDKLAEISWGNPGIARALWRYSLSREATGDDEEEEIQSEATGDNEEEVQSEAKGAPSYKTIWVQPITESVLPVVPTTFTNNDAFILQTLLIHDGLSRMLLQETLPLSASRISRRLQVMLNADLVRHKDILHKDGQTRDELFEVAPLGYRAVRAFLREQGFFVDDL